MAGGATTEHPLWAFAVAIHADPQVASACLRLQDEHGLDVCMLLACLWYAHDRQRALPLDRLRELRRRVATLAQWTARLRVLRRELSGPARQGPAWRGLYETTKAAELEAEALELSLLHDALAPDPAGATPPRVAAAESLGRLVEVYAGAGAAQGAEPLLNVLVAAVLDPRPAHKPS